jgi:hypothetical protein
MGILLKKLSDMVSVGIFSSRSKIMLVNLNPVKNNSLWCSVIKLSNLE